MRVLISSSARPSSRRRTTIPLSSSTTESSPNAVSRTLRAAMPAPTAITASTSIQAIVTHSSRTPWRSAAARAMSTAALSVS